MHISLLYAKRNQESCNYVMNKTDTGFVKCLLYCELRKMARKNYRNWFCIANLSLLIQTNQMMTRNKTVSIIHNYLW